MARWLLILLGIGGILLGMVLGAGVFYLMFFWALWFRG